MWDRDWLKKKYINQNPQKEIQKSTNIYLIINAEKSRYNSNKQQIVRWASVVYISSTKAFNGSLK